MPSAAIKQAVALLRERRDEAAHELASLTGEIAEIDGALRSLGAADIAVTIPDSLARQSPRQTVSASARQAALVRRSMRNFVRQYMEQTPRALSVNEIAEGLGAEVRGTRSDDRYRSAIRTALWNLRTEGAVEQAGNGLNIARKWLTDAEGPAATGPSDHATSSAGGGGTSEATHQDHDPIPGWDDRHGGDSPVTF